MMQDAQSLEPSVQSIPLRPDSDIWYQRIVALLIDSVVCILLVLLATKAFATAQISTNNAGWLPGTLLGVGTTYYGVCSLSAHCTTWWIGLPPFWSAVLVFCYFFLLEFYFGATLGKWIMGICVICGSNNSYTNLTLSSSFLRNLLRFVDALPVAYILGGIAIRFSSRYRRIGDMAAHTMVVKRVSVPQLHRSRQYIQRGLHIYMVLLLAFIIVCLTFTYFEKPALIIRNDITTKQIFQQENIPQIPHYTIDRSHWGTDATGRPVLIYPVEFVSMQNLQGQNARAKFCQGNVVFFWQWIDFDWVQESADYSCHPA